MRIKGFTLLEMILVISIISVFMLLMPTMFKGYSFLKWDVLKIKETITEAKIRAVTTKEKQHIEINNHHLSYNGKTYFFAKGVVCDSCDIDFNQAGNVDMGRTITCTYLDEIKKIVVTLGNSSVYVK